MLNSLTIAWHIMKRIILLFLIPANNDHSMCIDGISLHDLHVDRESWGMDVFYMGLPHVRNFLRKFCFVSQRRQSRLLGRNTS